MDKPNGIMVIPVDFKTGKYLVLHRVLNWRGWEFPKGGIEENEDPKNAVFRELSEETSLKNVKIIEQLSKRLEWVTSSNEPKKTSVVFVVSVDSTEKIDLSQEITEHDNYKWVSRKEALELLNFEDTKEFFLIAIEKYSLP